MQLVLDRPELQLAAEIVEARLYECRPDTGKSDEAEQLEPLLDGILNRRLEFDCDQLDRLRALLDEAWRQDRQRQHLASLRDKVTEVCAML